MHYENEEKSEERKVLTLFDSCYPIFSRRISVEGRITVGSFFRGVRSTFLFICSTTSNLNNFEPQQLQPQKRVQNEKKKQNRRPQPRKHTKDPTLAPLFFGTMRLFLDSTKGSPFVCFDILQHNGFQKIPKGPPFNIFQHCDTVQKSH